MRDSNRLLAQMAQDLGFLMLMSGPCSLTANPFRSAEGGLWVYLTITFLCLPGMVNSDLREAVTLRYSFSCPQHMVSTQ